jgi:hypothetical protein
MHDALVIKKWHGWQSLDKLESGKGTLAERERRKSGRARLKEQKQRTANQGISDVHCKPSVRARDAQRKRHRHACCKRKTEKRQSTLKRARNKELQLKAYVMFIANHRYAHVTHKESGKSTLAERERRKSGKARLKEQEKRTAKQGISDVDCKPLIGTRT